MLRRRRRDVDDRRGREEVVQDGRVEEDLGPNVDEVVVDEVLEVALPQLSMMTKRTKKLVK